MPDYVDWDTAVPGFVKLCKASLALPYEMSTMTNSIKAQRNVLFFPSIPIYDKCVCTLGKESWIIRFGRSPQPTMKFGCQISYAWQRKLDN